MASQNAGRRMTVQADRSRLRRLYRAALAGADPQAAVRRALEERAVRAVLAGAGRVGVFASGKAAAAMLAGAGSVLGPRLAVVPRGGVRPKAKAEVLTAAHPEPDRSSVRAAKRALEFFSQFGEGDAILCLVSGGTSALLCLPRPGLTLTEKRRRIALLSRRGASIAEVNRLRASLSSVKAGRLGRATRARLVTLVLSDVPGDRPALVGSGPTVRRRRGDVVRVVATNASGLAAAAKQARAVGLTPRRAGWCLSGEAKEAGARLARAALRLEPGEALLAGGETTVTIGGRRGRGGRSLELALGAAVLLAGCDVVLLAAGSDGRDGTSPAAGAFADGTTLARAALRGLDPRAAFAGHETHAFFGRLRDLFVTGATGGNVADWVFAVRRGLRRSRL
jgi:glycerate 2-kinase